MNKSKNLDQKIRSIVAREREALAELIVELKNLDGIRGFVELGYRSMFDYLTKGLSYSAGAAQRRIDAARLAREVPDLPFMLESGGLDFHHVTTVSKAIRQTGRKVSAEEKREVIERLAGASESKTQQTVAAFFDLETIHETKRVVQKDESVRIELTVSRELARKIEQAQALVSHAVPTRDLAAFIEFVSDKIIKEKTTATVAVEKSTATMAVPAKRIRVHIHKQVRKEQPCCMNCGSEWFPQTDHKKSKWAGGSDEIENLQTLCGPCNRAKYERERAEQRSRV